MSPPRPEPSLAEQVVAAAAYALSKGLADAAFTTALTGLYNTRAFDLLAREHDRGVGDRLGVAFIDLAGFKAINDQYGHDAGDAAISAAGERARGVAQILGGHAYHVGGDEFLIIFPAASLSSFHEAAVPLMKFEVAIESKSLLRFPVSATVGLAPASPTEPLATVRLRAEQACRAAKVRQLRQPLVWDEEKEDVKIVDPRWRCAACGATVSLLVPEEAWRPDGPHPCPNCQSALGTEPPAPTGA